MSKPKQVPEAEGFGQGAGGPSHQKPKKGEQDGENKLGSATPSKEELFGNE
jgi:hypothetical protein